MEKELNYVLALGSDSQLKPSESAIGSLEYMKNDMQDVMNGYFKLGFHLDEAQRLGYYKQFGYTSIHDFALDNLGIDKTLCYRCMNVFRRFAKKTDTWVKTMWIEDKYKDFSFSQLVEMESFKSNVALRYVTPDMTVRQIRQYKKEAGSWCDSNKAERIKKEVMAESASDKNTVATSQPEKLQGEVINQDGTVVSPAPEEKKYTRLHTSDFVCFKGAVLANRIKKAHPICSKDISIKIYDTKGKKLHSFEVEVLLDAGREVVYRLVDEEKKQ